MAEHGKGEGRLGWELRRPRNGGTWNEPARLSKVTSNSGLQQSCVTEHLTFLCEIPASSQDVDGGWDICLD